MKSLTISINQRAYTSELFLAFSADRKINTIFGYADVNGGVAGDFFIWIMQDPRESGKTLLEHKIERFPSCDPRLTSIEGTVICALFSDEWLKFCQKSAAQEWTVTE